MVIEMGRNRRIVVNGAVDAEAFAHVLDVLDPRFAILLPQPGLRVV